MAKRLIHLPLCGWNFDLAPLALVHVVVDPLRPEILPQSLFNGRYLTDVQQDVHKMLESGRDVSALETGDILPHVATKNLVEGGRLLTGVVQSLDGSGRQAVGRVPVQKRPLEGLDEVPQKLVSVLLPAGYPSLVKSNSISCCWLCKIIRYVLTIKGCVLCLLFCDEGVADAGRNVRVQLSSQRGH